eukprot:345133-Pleurochrysis_carterae.AAC.7
MALHANLAIAQINFGNGELLLQPAALTRTICGCGGTTQLLWRKAMSICMQCPPLYKKQSRNVYLLHAIAGSIGSTREYVAARVIRNGLKQVLKDAQILLSRKSVIMRVYFCRPKLLATC